MDTIRCTAALFDFDGVIMDTEGQYTAFWHEIGKEYLGKPDIGIELKGQTLAYIFETYFKDEEKAQHDITAALYRFEQEMSYDYVPGVLDFVEDLRRNGVKTAVVTSSNRQKMAVVYRKRQEVKALFDSIITAEQTARSKPAPDCYITAMHQFSSTPQTSCVFEDSFNGLKAGMASGAMVFGLATTNPREAITGLCHHVLDDFKGFTFAHMQKLFSKTIVTCH